MKKLVSLLVGLMLLVSVFPIVGNVRGDSVISIPVSPGGFQLERVSGYSMPLVFDMNPDELTDFRGKLFYEGLSLTQDISMPQIPIITKRIHFEDKNPVSITVTSADWITTTIPKLEKFYPKTWDDKTIDYPEIPWEGKYPESLGDFRDEEGADGHWLSIAVAPVSLNFDRNEMLVFTHLELAINYTLDETYQTTSTSEEKEVEKALILCPQLLKSSAESLAVIQRADGYEVEVITVSEIKSGYSPQEEEPEDITGFEEFSKSQKEHMSAYDYDLAKTIRSYFETRIDDLDYVTIMGDGELVPPSFYSLNSFTYYEFDKYVPTDLFYASPDLDTIPNFALGRLPVRNSDEAKIVVEKLKNYREALKEDDWFHKINLGGGDPFNGGFEGEIDCQALIDMGMLDGFEVEKYYKTREKFGSSDLLEAFNDDAGFLYTVNHGSGEALITEPGEVTTEDILALPKRNKLPILLTPSCINGMYDSTIVDHKLNEYEGGDGLSFSQACIAAPGGPIAYFGGSRLNYAGINWQIEGGVVKTLPFTQMDRFLQEVMNSYHNWSTTLGEMTVNAYKKYVGIGSFSFFGTGSKTLMAFVFFGDPTIKLPPTPGGSPHRIPDIELVDAPMRDLGYGSIKIPVLSIVDENSLKIKSDIPWINYEIIKLESDLEIVSDWKKVEPDSERLFDITVKPEDKSFWQLRLELPNLTEVWIYYISAADHDLSIETTRDFFITKPKPREHFTFYVTNDGLKTEENIEVDLFFNNKKIETRKILELENGYYETVYFKVDEPGIGEHEVRAELRFDGEDQYPEDNEFKRTLFVTEEETCKAVSLVTYFFPSHKAKEYFELDEYNKKAPGFDGKPTEITFAGSDSYWALIFGYPIPDLVEMGADSVILAHPYAVNPFSTDSINKLNDFNKDGGSIIGMGCLADSTAAPFFNQVYDWFGLDKDVKIKLKEAEGTKFEPVSKDSPFFAGGITSPLELNTKNKNEPVNSTWEEMIIDEKSEISATNSDKSDIILVNNQNIYISSNFDVETDDELRFLYNLIAYNLRPRKDAMISLSGIQCEPALPTVGEEIRIAVTVENVGNTVLKDVNVELDGLKQNIEKIEIGETGEVVFEMTAPQKVGLFVLTPVVTVENDQDNENNSTSLRIRVREKQVSSTEKIISEMNINDGDILPHKSILIKGKAKPGAFINISGSIGRADDNGDFVIPFEPTSTKGLVVRAKVNGSSEEFKVWTAFEYGGSVGCMLDEKDFLAESNFVVKTDSSVLRNLEDTLYFNIDEVADYLKLELNGDETNLTLSGEAVEFKFSTDAGKITKKIGDWTEEFDLTDKIIKENNKLYLSLETLSKIDFSVDFDDKTSSLLLRFPKKSIPASLMSLTSFSDTSNSKKISIPSEANYGKPKLVSFGALDGEVSSMLTFRSTSKKLYLWTNRGIQEWTHDGEFVKAKGFPDTLAQDLDIDWSDIYHASSSRYGNSGLSFFITSSGGLNIISGERMVIYDRDWELLKVLKFDDEMLVGTAKTDNDGNIYLFDYYENCHVFSDSGEKIADFELIDSDGERIDSVNVHTVTPDGKLVVIKAQGSSFGWFSFGSNEWNIYLYDTSGNILDEKRFEVNEEEETEEEDLPAVPSHIIADKDGTFWLIDSAWNETVIRHWDSNFEETSSEVSDMSLRRINDIFQGNDGNFLAGGQFQKEKDSKTKYFKILSFTEKFEESYMVPSARTDSKQRFYYPNYLTYDPDGNLLAIANREIRKYDKMGSFVEEVFFKDKKGEMVSPTWFTFEGDNIYTIISDWRETVVAVANSEYEITQKIPLVVEATKEREEYNLNPRNIVADESADELFILDGYESNAVQVVSLYSNLSDNEEIEKIEILRSFVPRGIGEGKVTFPKYLRKFEDKLFILDGSTKKIVTYNTKGEFLFEFGGEGETPGRMMTPYSMSIDENGLIWITDAILSKISIFDTNGTYITALGREGNLIPAGTIEEYKSDPFSLLYPVEACANAGQISILDYCHNRLIMLNSLEDTMNMNIIPENPELSMYNTQMTATSEITITNTGPGTLEGTLSCEDENLSIEPSEFTGNFVSISLKYDTEGIEWFDVPEFVFLEVESSIGISTIKLPIIFKKTEFTVKVGSQIASGASGVHRLIKKPLEIGDSYLVASTDLERLIPLIGIKSTSNDTLYYNLGSRGLGFTKGKNIAELRIGEDVFKIHLDTEIEVLPDGSFLLPLDVITSFTGCEIVKEEDVLKVVSRN